MHSQNSHIGNMIMCNNRVFSLPNIEQLCFRQVTLNMLNATENEVDVEGLSTEVKLEFEGSNDDVTT